jgi:hypothetical protein
MFTVPYILIAISFLATALIFWGGFREQSRNS